MREEENWRLDGGGFWLSSNGDEKSSIIKKKDAQEREWRKVYVCMDI